MTTRRSPEAHGFAVVTLTFSVVRRGSFMRESAEARGLDRLTLLVRIIGRSRFRDEQVYQGTTNRVNGLASRVLEKSSSVELA
jgi:hypothetical protein